MADVRSLGVAIEEYSIEHDHYPEANSIEDLSELLSPAYIRNVPGTDGWGHALSIQSDAAGYTIVSFGSDGGRDEALDEPQSDPTSDIVFSNGSFISRPER